MTKADLGVVVRSACVVIREYTEAAIAPLLERLTVVENRASIPGPAGRDGQPGPAGDRGDKGDAGMPGPPVSEETVAGLVAAAVAKAINALPVPKSVSGALIDRSGTLVLTYSDGTTAELGAVVGRDADQDALKEFIVAEVAKIPAPLNGKDGRDGRDGIDGQNGRDVDQVELQKFIVAEVAKIPAPLNGKDGRDGRDGINGQNGRDVDQAELQKFILAEVAKIPAPLNGKDGRDGIDGQNGRNGIDGKDGLGFEDVDLVIGEDGSVVAEFTRGSLKKSWLLPLPMYRDVFSEGTVYRVGDMVTYAGSVWIAKAPTSAKPGLATPDSRAWKLCVKAGRDGREGKPGKDGAPGPKGEKGDPGIKYES